MLCCAPVCPHDQSNSPLSSLQSITPINQNESATRIKYTNPLSHRWSAWLWSPLVEWSPVLWSPVLCCGAVCCCAGWVMAPWFPAFAPKQDCARPHAEAVLWWVRGWSPACCCQCDSDWAFPQLQHQHVRAATPALPGRDISIIQTLSISNE